jgi:3-phenylpropionate/trans-cinnamate dioxygenase ferredoxin reductase subunit
VEGSDGARDAQGLDAYTRLPYLFSDQYDLGMEYVGHGDGTDAVVVRGDRDAREFIAFWQRDGIVAAAMNVNVWDVMDDLKAIVEARVPVDPMRLADADVPLRELLL